MIISIQNCGVSPDPADYLKGIANAGSITNLVLMTCKGECKYFPNTTFSVEMPDQVFMFSDGGITDDWEEQLENLKKAIDGEHDVLPNNYAKIEVDIFKGIIVITPYDQ
ncbi:MAG: hypothetical protein LUC17_02945 [Oscillospiraceae bacterium]|nr:hypothetical protein [Oscillospiraceae bacterium]